MADQKQQKQLYSAQITKEDADKFKSVADHQGVSMAGLLRKWIHRSYKRIEGGK